MKGKHVSSAPRPHPQESAASEGATGPVPLSFVLKQLRGLGHLEAQIGKQKHLIFFLR